MARAKPLHKPTGAQETPFTPKVGQGATSSWGWRLHECEKCGGSLYRERWADSWCCINCGSLGPTTIGGPDSPPLTPRVARRARTPTRAPETSGVEAGA
jgi:hypothetical protein